MDLFSITLIGLLRVSLLFLINNALILSCPVLFFGFSDFIRVKISNGSVGAR